MRVMRLAFMCVVVAGATVAADAAPRFIGAKTRTAEPLCGTLSPVRADAALKAELDRYGLKVWSFSDGTNTVHALHFSPKPRGRERFPMIVYLPGNGERGDPIRQFRQRRIFDLVTSQAFQARRPCHLLALSPPESTGTLLGGTRVRPTAVQRLLHDAVRTVARTSPVAVDPGRLYLTGFSYGGSGCSALALRFPGEYAAVVPIAALPPSPALLDANRPGSWWFFYNEGDYARAQVSVDGLHRFRNGVIAAGGDFRIGTYPAAGHDAWTKAWCEDAVWDWVFSKGVKAHAARPVRGGPSAGEAFRLVKEGTCTASLPGKDDAHGPERMLDGLDATYYESGEAAARGDWVQVAFGEPVGGRFVVHSGRRDDSGLLQQGVVEASADGRRWRRVGLFAKKDGTARIDLRTPVRLLRIVCTGARPQPLILRKIVPEGR